jgi:hypothetical protein
LEIIYYFDGANINIFANFLSTSFFYFFLRSTQPRFSSHFVPLSPLSPLPFGTTGGYRLYRG